MNVKELVTTITLIDRTTFLRSALISYISLEDLKKVLDEGIRSVEISPSVIHEIAEKRIQKYAVEASEMSFCAGSVGGIWLMPVDYAQFFISSSQLLQELYYLYGMDEQMPIQSKQDVEMLLCLIAGGSGTVKTAGSALGALSKYLLKRTGKKMAFRFLPIIGGVSSAAFTYSSMVSIAHEFIMYMKELPIDNTNEQPLVKKIETFIDVEYQEAEAVLYKFCNLEKLKELYQYVEAGYLSDDEFKKLKKEI